MKVLKENETVELKKSTSEIKEAVIAGTAQKTTQNTTQKIVADFVNIPPQLPSQLPPQLIKNISNYYFN